MILLDAIVAGLLFKLFGVKGLYCLAMTCMIAFLRISYSTERHYDMCERVINVLGEENKEKI